MEFGCSQCLASAIESHNLLLLLELLQRPVAYRDMFWAPIPAAWQNDYYDVDYAYPRVSDDSDPTRIWRPDCGHESFDINICGPIHSTGLSAKILVSLPILARWHSSKDFPVEHELCISGKFDLNEPQLYHLPDPDTIEPSANPESFINLSSQLSLILLQFEIVKPPSGLPRYIPDVSHVQLNHLMDVNERIVVRGSVFPKEPYWAIKRSSTTLSREYYGHFDLSFERLGRFSLNSSIHEQLMSDIRQCVHSGRDVNNGFWNEIIVWTPFWTHQTQFEIRFILSSIMNLITEIITFEKVVKLDDYYEFVVFLLQSGLSYFPEWMYCNNFEVYFLSFNNCKWPTRLFRQLLSLGFARQELHPIGMKLIDGQLNETKRRLQEKQYLNFI